MPASERFAFRRPPEPAPDDVVDADVVDDGDGQESGAELGITVLADVRPIEPVSPASLPAVQAAAVAATGFVAGAATLVLARRYGARKLARAHQRQRRSLDGLPILASRSFLVDVHLIGKPEE